MTDSTKETKIVSAEEASVSGQYLTFLLSQEQYGFEILKVLEIFGMMKITEVPRAPDYLKGVINLRGKIIPVMDLRLKFNLPERAYDQKTCIVVVKGSMGDFDMPIGVIVDTVLEVQDYAASAVAPRPEYGSQLKTDFITGIGRLEDDTVTILLDLDKILVGIDPHFLDQKTEESFTEAAG